MTFGSILIWVFLGSAFIIVAILAFFMLINSKSSASDTETYDEGYDVGKKVSHYWQDEDDPEPDPYHSLKRWAMPPEEEDEPPLPQQEPAAGEPPLDPIVSELLNDQLPGGIKGRS